MKMKAIIATIASLALVAGVGTAVVMSDDKPATETSVSVAEDSTSKPEDSVAEAEDASGSDATAEDGKDTGSSGEDKANTDTDDVKDVAESDGAKNATGKNTAKAPAAPAAKEQDTTPVEPAANQSDNDSAATGSENSSGSAQVSGSDTGNSGTTGVNPPHTDTSDETVSHKDVSAADIVRLTNDERTKNGMDALESVGEIQSAADTRAKEIVTNFSHTRPDGTSFVTAISGKYAHFGENIARYSGNVTAEEFVSMWMNSDSHRANILGDYTGIAVGVYYNKDTDTTYAVQLFVKNVEAPKYTYTLNVVAPTCTEQGYTEHICNEDPAKSFTDSYVEPLGHDLDDGTITKEATCTEDGVKTLHCSRCDYTETETIKATGHTPEVKNAKDATCTEDGYTGDTVCSVCGTTITKGEVIKALGHDLDDGAITKPATCTEDGVKTFHCSRCDYTETEAIKATGHTPEVKDAKDATCTEDGYTGDTVCSICGATIAKGEIIKATGHNFVDGVCTVCGTPDPDYTDPNPEYTYTVNVVAPTCTEQGYTEHICNEDPAQSFKDTYVPALGHQWNGNSIGSVCTVCQTPRFQYDHTVEPTCEDNGYDVYVDVSDATNIRKANFTDPDDSKHNFVDGVCTVCGEKDPSASNPGSSFDKNYNKDLYNNTIRNNTNNERTASGLYELRYASEYQAAADIRAQEIATNFSHTRPDGTGPETALAALGCKYTNVGENIAMVSSMYRPEQIVDNWMASPSHKSNILSNAFDSFVVGTYCTDGHVYAVQLFFASADANSVQTMTLDEDAAMASAPEAAEEATPAPTEEPTVTEAPETVEPTPDVTPAPTEEPEVTEDVVEATPVPTPEATPEPTPVPTPEVTPAPIETPAPVEEVAPVETPAPEATPAPTEAPAEPVQEEVPVQEQDVTVPPEETELVVPKMEEVPGDVPADAAE